MRHFCLAVALLVGLGGVSEAGWHKASSGPYYYWLGADGRCDGYLYQAHHTPQWGWWYQNIGPWQQYVQQPVQQAAVQPAYPGGSFAYFQDLPRQQGNTIYGSYDPTYNSFADPYRNFDIGAHLNQLSSLAAQSEATSARIHADVSATLQQSIYSHQLALQAGGSHAAYGGQGGAGGVVLPGDRAGVGVVSGGSPGIPGGVPGIAPGGQPPQGGPPAEQPPQGEPAAGGKIDAPPISSPVEAGKAAASDEDAFKQLTLIVSAKCLDCHGGGKTAGDQRLRLGTGRTVNFNALTERQSAKIWERVGIAGTMPPGGPLPAAEMALFRRFFEAAGGKQ